jgi:peptidyl-prolyl cis-trans isomerase A (cyclophilin A)
MYSICISALRPGFPLFLLSIMAMSAGAPNGSVNSQPLPGDLPLHEAAPDSFIVHIETTRGTLIIQGVREWSPLAADRFYHLVNGGFYDGLIIFRVGGTMSATGRVAQFGIPAEPEIYRAWEDVTISDEPVRTGNNRGTLIFARGGPDTRGTQIALNLTDNPGLDTVDFEGVSGFPPFAYVIHGMETADSFFGEYGNEPMQMYDSLTAKGNEFIERVFPGLDRILKARIAGQD